jgi:hypothetical protein
MNLQQPQLTQTLSSCRHICSCDRYHSCQIWSIDPRVLDKCEEKATDDTTSAEISQAVDKPAILRNKEFLNYDNDNENGVPQHRSDSLNSIEYGNVREMLRSGTAPHQLVTAPVHPTVTAGEIANKPSRKLPFTHRRIPLI